MPLIVVFPHVVHEPPTVTGVALCHKKRLDAHELQNS
jgi:hypothetical protein